MIFGSQRAQSPAQYACTCGTWNGSSMYGSVTTVFSSFRVMTESEAKATKAVAPSCDCPESDMVGRV